MAHDIIDLISSSPPPVPETTSKGKQPVESGQHGVQRGPVNTIAQDLLDFEDDFDTTGDLDEPIEPSGARLPPTSHLEDNSLPKSPSQSRHIDGKAVARKDPDAGLDVFLSSDDFEITSSFLAEPTLIETNGNKRRRVSPGVNKLGPPSHTSSARNEGSSAPKADEVRETEDSILLTSSPIRADSIYQQGTTSQRLEPTHTSTKTARVPSQSPDPFATSPLPASKPDPVPALAQEPSSDPFRSSPRPRSPRPAVSTGRAPEADSTRSSRSAARRAPTTSDQRWHDPIFSSSAPEELTTKSRSKAKESSLATVIDLASSGSEAAAASEDDLPDIAKFDASRYKVRKRSPMRRSRSDVLPSTSRSKTTKPAKSAAERTAEKDQRAAAKEAEKERKKKEKDIEKDAKRREKERNAALAEVNKIRTDKKVSTPEMIIDLPSSLNATIKTQAETLLEALDVHYTTWDSPVENAIKWRRKITSRFNEDMGHWEPIPRRVDDEKHILVVMTADEFVELAINEKLDECVERIREHYPTHEVVYLMEGMNTWFRKNRNLRNRQFTSGVRAEGAAPTTGRRRNVRPVEYVPEDTIEDALLQLQVVHDGLIHHTALPLETAQWITIFTQHISTIPYRKQKDQATLGAGFCMESGQVKTGDDAKDSYIRLLQEIARVTTPISYGIAAEFGTVSKLVNGLVKEGPMRLENVRKSANKDGALSDRAIGQAVSRRLHKVFTGRDENSTDV